MKLLRRTIPVAVTVGTTSGLLVATIDLVNGLFENPHFFSTAIGLIIYIFRAYFYYLIIFIPAGIILNLLICLVIPKKMREADYARILEYNVWALLFCLMLFYYTWVEQEIVADVMRMRPGILPKAHFLFTVVGTSALLSFIVAGAVHQLSKKLPPGRLEIYMSSLIWFLLLFPVIGEWVVTGLIPNWPNIIELIILVILAFLIGFLVKFLNRFTYALIGLKKKPWMGLGAVILVIVIVSGILSLLKPSPSLTPRAGNDINILIFSIDTLRADHLGCYGYDPRYPKIEPQDFSPHIDALASEGLLFEDAYSTSPWTLASVASWMTGVWPAESGGTYLNRRVFGALTTLPEALREEGYVTAAFVANPFLGPQTGIGTGFNQFDEFFSSKGYAKGLFVDKIRFWILNRMDILGFSEGGKEISELQLRQAKKWLSENRKNKFFLWVHLYDPHYPYAPPEPYSDDIPDIEGIRRINFYRSLPIWRIGASHHKYGLRRHIVNLYDAELRSSDEMVGRMMGILDEMELTRDTLVVLTSDHGEEFFEHGRLEHGHTQYDELLHVPLIIKLPGRVPEGSRIKETVSLIDLFPTLLEFGGASIEPKVYRGESLAQAILNADMSLAGKGGMQLDPWSSTRTTILDQPPVNEEANPVGDAMEILADEIEYRSAGESIDFPEGRLIFAEDMFYFDSDLKSIRIGDWKLIHSRNRFHDFRLWDERVTDETLREYGLPDLLEGDELYNIADDPNELKNVIYDFPEIARYLRRYLDLIDELNREQAVTRKEMEGDVKFFGAGLKSLTRSFGYWDS